MAQHENGLKIDSGCPELDVKINEWLLWDKNEATNKEIKHLIEENEWDELKKRLLTRLAFGTAGLRGVMQAGNNAMNDLVVIQSAQGLLEYILQCYSSEVDRKRGIVLGYDGRYHSKRFAQLTACVFINKGIPVWLYTTTVATPFVPFAVLEKKCLAGVMVTASHNPKEDNGYKVYWTNSAQIISPHDKNIQNSILANLKPLDSSWNLDLLKSPLLQDPYNEMVNLYYKKLLQNIPNELITEHNAKVKRRFVYTAMHGVGYPYVKKCFEVAQLEPVISVKEQQDPDPEFPTVKFPNPEEGKSSLILSIELANRSGCDVILANDPDADRLACAEKKPNGEWKVFTGNELGSLLGWWAVECYKRQHTDVDLSQCYVLASTVSSKMLKSMAAIDGYKFEDTLTGFKWMGNRSVELMASGKTVLFAFEEAIGFMFSPAVLDKDGVSAATHLATLSSYLWSIQTMTLLQKLEELYQTYGYHFSVTSYFLCYDPVMIVKIFERIRNLNGDGVYPISILGGKFPIKAIRDLTTGIDTSQPDGKALFPTSKSTQMITFTFENGVVVTLRTSGTEPKIKYYAEMCATPGNSDYDGLRKLLNEMIDAIVAEFLEPEKNNLTPRSE